MWVEIHVFLFVNQTYTNICYNDLNLMRNIKIDFKISILGFHFDKKRYSFFWDKQVGLKSFFFFFFFWGGGGSKI